MDARAFDLAVAGFRGELTVTPDGVAGGVADGFCADPARPGLRCWVEILVEGQLEATILARDIREDLPARGFADPGHGFRVRLESLPPRPDLLVWARVKGARRGFAQTLLTRPGLTEGVPAREAALAAHIAGLSDRLGRPRPASREPWREACAGLAAVLARPAGRPFPAPLLAFVRHPAATFAVPLGAGLEDALRRLAWLAPLAGACAAEVLALDVEGDPDLAVLPALGPNLRLVAPVPDPRHAAAGHARSELIALFDPRGPAPSLAVLQHALGLGDRPEDAVAGVAIVPRARLAALAA